MRYQYQSKADSISARNIKHDESLELLLYNRLNFSTLLVNLIIQTNWLSKDH